MNDRRGARSDSGLLDAEHTRYIVSTKSRSHVRVRILLDLPHRVVGGSCAEEEAEAYPGRITTQSLTRVHFRESGNTRARRLRVSSTNNRTRSFRRGAASPTSAPRARRTRRGRSNRDRHRETATRRTDGETEPRGEKYTKTVTGDRWKNEEGTSRDEGCTKKGVLPHARAESYRVNCKYFPRGTATGIRFHPPCRFHPIQ